MGAKIVRIDVITKDRYGRIVGKVYLSDGSTLNKRLVEAGLAWVYRQYAKDPVLFGLKAKAKIAKRGLWSDPKSVPPWEWRHGAGWGTEASSTKVSLSTTILRCGQKQYCKEMASCEEAIFFLTQCGVSSLDSDKDGVPCESHCR